MTKKSSHGRRSLYNRESTEALLALHASGKTILQACKQSGIKADTYFQWLERDKDGLKERHRRAKELYAEWLNDRIDEIIVAPLSEEEKNHPQAIKLREVFVKKKMWELEKRHRHVYGNHVSVEQKHTIDLKPLMDRVQHSIQSKGLKPVKALDKQT
ncbi:hypothetical protein, partial [Candidatus Liberibacter asiaticus]